jgi:ribonuclease Y
MSLAEAQEQGETQGQPHSFYVKVSGGLGVDKEVIRLTLEEVFSKKLQDEGSIHRAIEKNRKRVNQLIVRLGNEAAKKLDLKGIHPEIIKLIGSLNYRTSHRQNQYFHSLEVATLAGLIAMELGVDPQLARRAGILHDIGKVLDYRIEGSHAVISGDYAANFGENTDVVDTVLSHHDDKVVETPHAYILKTADALSGARPGARVDMEEGYSRRMDGISGVVNSFQDAGVLSSVIMHAGREVHVFVDSHKVQQSNMNDLATNIARKLEDEVEYPGQIRVTIIRRTEVAEVA